MKLKVILVLVLIGMTVSAQGQSEVNEYKNFPLVITVQFHCFSLPFKDLKTNFKNIGIGIGTEVSYNSKENWVQQVNLMWYHNKMVGNGVLLYTQMAWRPGVGSDGFAEVKAGAGYLYSFRPGKSYRQINGEWHSVGHKGKGMLTVPVGISIGSNIYSSGSSFSPFLSYQFLIVNGYNKSVPIVPNTLVQAGVRIHTK